jgi:YfiR/HmsC-like
LACAWAAPRGGHAQTNTEARLRAKLTMNLARFTQWPASSFTSPTESFVVCVAHRGTAIGAAFAELDGGALGQRPLRVVSNPSTLPASCHLLYIEAEAERGAAALLAAAANSAVLTVGDGADFMRRGMIELVNVNDAIRFDVNLGRLRKAQLEFNSQALKLARRVEE